MNYRHIYHAGSVHDIIKHIVLIAALKNLLKKPKSFNVLDAFAGIGIYDLNLKQANQTLEYEQGIKRLWESQLSDLPPNIKQLLDISKSFNVKNIYPGSPYIISYMLRANDKLIACELHSEDYQNLKAVFQDHKNVHIHKIDAYNAIKAFLPFEDKRGLIFLDPPFEKKNEFNALYEALKVLAQRAKNLCIIIWYPNKYQLQVKDFIGQASQLPFAEMHNINFSLDNQIKLNSSSMMIINPPDLKEDITRELNFLVKKIYDNQASFSYEIFNRKK